jgi:microcin C transport system permease protein
LPNSLTPAITFIPFELAGGITALTALDFLGFGMPSGSPSLGEMLMQAKDNIHAYWIGLSVFLTLSLILILLIFTGEGIRSAYDPKKKYAKMGL